MEMISDSPVWLNETHPNYNKWKRARELSLERGKLVHSALSQFMELKHLSILDLGSGEGGTAKVFSENNFIVSFDLSLIRLQRQKDSIDLNSRTKEIKLVNGNALQLPFSDNSFDLIIMQDVIEHLDNHMNFYNEIRRVLKQKGMIYLSTPNKLSVLNFFSDPHFGLPVVSILNRKSIKKYFLRYFRKDDFKRDDIAQLLSINDLIDLFGKEFHFYINTKFVVKELFNGNKGIVWSSFHLNLIAVVRFLKLDWLIIKFASNKYGFINKYVTPAFYITLKRRDTNLPAKESFTYSQ